MTIFVSRAASHGNVPTPGQAGVIMIAEFTHTIDAAYTAATPDIIEIGVLPAFAKPVRMSITGGALAVSTADVGLMSGDPQDDQSARTSGDEFLSATSIVSATQDVPIETCMEIAPVAYDRGIGVKLSADQTAGATKTVTIRMEYVL
ncbi:MULTISPECIES: hypothetical protein [unclassified Mameliella]|uniref:hypothetical protein n=1 Tax=Mameliella sp. LZ-28 TaxID=2484146 RepID=UPI00143F9821|nr:hypothetical protein [Mameliella sp. LZ-28]MCR9276248.1 hypothetical protein [Paracoccaceae bacterium]